jgi:hypothetical protein
VTAGLQTGGLLDINRVRHRCVAQLVEQRSPKPQVVGSSPAAPANFVVGRF